MKIFSPGQRIWISPEGFHSSHSDAGDVGQKRLILRVADTLPIRITISTGVRVSSDLVADDVEAAKGDKQGNLRDQPTGRVLMPNVQDDDSV
jgi:hypothetical protein